MSSPANINKQPNSHMCFVCGLQNPFGLHLPFYDDGKDTVTSEFVIQPNHQGYPGVAHGGIVAAILDEVGGRTVMIADPQRFFVTAKFEIKYRQPVPVEQPLRGVGRLLKINTRLARAQAEVQNAAGTTLAEADLTLVNAPAGMFDASEADRLGWRVYLE